MSDILGRLVVVCCGAGAAIFLAIPFMMDFERGKIIKYALKFLLCDFIGFLFIGIAAFVSISRGSIHWSFYIPVCIIGPIAGLNKAKRDRDRANKE